MPPVDYRILSSSLSSHNTATDPASGGEALTLLHYICLPTAFSFIDLAVLLSRAGSVELVLPLTKQTAVTKKHFFYLEIFIP